MAQGSMHGSMNLGAFIDGARPASKAAVKRALADGASAVSFDNTAAFGPHAGCTFNANDLPDGQHYLVGPDPYTRRNFYGQVIVSHDANGTPVLKLT